MYSHSTRLNTNCLFVLRPKNILDLTFSWSDLRTSGDSLDPITYRSTSSMDNGEKETVCQSNGKGRREFQSTLVYYLNRSYIILTFDTRGEGWELVFRKVYVGRYKKGRGGRITLMSLIPSSVHNFYHCSTLPFSNPGFSEWLVLECWF